MVVDVDEADRREAEEAAERRELDKQENDLLEKLLLPTATKISYEVSTEDNPELELDGKLDDKDSVQEVSSSAAVEKRAWRDENDLDETKKLQLT